MEKQCSIGTLKQYMSFLSGTVLLEYLIRFILLLNFEKIMENCIEGFNTQLYVGHNFFLKPHSILSYTGQCV